MIVLPPPCWQFHLPTSMAAADSRGLVLSDHDKLVLFHLKKKYENDDKKKWTNTVHRASNFYHKPWAMGDKAQEKVKNCFRASAEARMNWKKVEEGARFTVLAVWTWRQTTTRRSRRKEDGTRTRRAGRRLASAAPHQRRPAPAAAAAAPLKLWVDT